MEDVKFCPLGKVCSDKESKMVCEWFITLYDGEKKPKQACAIRWIPMLITENTGVSTFISRLASQYMRAFIKEAGPEEGKVQGDKNGNGK